MVLVSLHWYLHIWGSSLLFQPFSAVVWATDLFHCPGSGFRYAAQLLDISDQTAWFGGAGGYAQQLSKATDLLPYLHRPPYCALWLGQTALWGPKLRRFSDWALWPDGAASSTLRMSRTNGWDLHAGATTSRNMVQGPWAHLDLPPFLSLADSPRDLHEAVSKGASLKVSQCAGEAECPPCALLFQLEKLQIERDSSV